FFQAEDGIRDYKVTGVQTCALPILASVRAGSVDAPVFRALVRAVSLVRRRLQADRGAAHGDGASERGGVRQLVRQRVSRARPVRSEERRVGKECGWRGSSAR